MEPAQDPSPQPARPPVQPWAEPTPPGWIMAAKRGCAQCLGRLRIPPAAPPFSQGPNVGRYLCMDCWTLYWSEHPECLADEETRKYVAEDAARIRLNHQASVLFEEGKSKVYLSSRGTIVFDIRPNPDLAPNEYDAERLAILVRATNQVAAKKAPQAVRIA